MSTREVSLEDLCIGAIKKQSKEQDMEPKDSCVKPAGGPIMPVSEETPREQIKGSKEVLKMIAKVGKPAPDFEASAFIDGGFKNIKLSDYKGHWVVICFYPGDFTFV
jgi:hypothetical protein